ncbi:response regulator [Pseudomonas oryzihabitans]|uniref:response regulator n=1 Tax=Pseudomonas oryzihabitans TaxID=47885 RepID=UPI003D068888
MSAYEWITLSLREVDRLKFIQAVTEGFLTHTRAFQSLQLSTPQVHRLVQRYRDASVSGVTSRKRSKPSNHQLWPGVEHHVAALIRQHYQDFGPVFAAKKLLGCHGLRLAKKTVRRIMMDAGVMKAASAATAQGVPATQSPSLPGRVFKPYRMTKDVKQGTGLGLSQVYGFVKQSCGHVKLYSEVGHGTSVNIYVPRFYGAVDPVVRVELPDEVLPRAKANECILVVEDDPRVRVISTEALLELGYQVIDTDNGPAALQLLAEHPEISLLFTDVVMPDMTGRELADQVALRQPTLPVLYTTGYTRNAIVHNGTLDRGVELLPKPFTLRDLAIKVRQVLDS